MTFEGLLLQLLLGFAFLVFLVASGAGIYLVILSEVKGLSPNTPKMRILWVWGLVVLLGSLGTVVIFTALGIARLAGG